jgi:2-methylcitrate dehydratase PrpD
VSRLDSSTRDQRVGKLEHTLAEFVVGLGLSSVPAETQRIVRRMVMAVAGTGFAGAAEDGVRRLRELLVEAGGAPQATVLVYGDRLPARAAAQLNGTMCRALDFCDAMAPGRTSAPRCFRRRWLRRSSPAAVRRGVPDRARGRRRAQLAIQSQRGAVRRLRPDRHRRRVRGGGGRLANPRPDGGADACMPWRSRSIAAEAASRATSTARSACAWCKGWVAEAGIQCAQMAQRGITGPDQLPERPLRLRHLYGRGTLEAESVTHGLGDAWKVANVRLQEVPELRRHAGRDGARPRAWCRSWAWRHRTSAKRWFACRLCPSAGRARLSDRRQPSGRSQFNAGYCVANAFVRRSSLLKHFAPSQVDDAAVQEMIGRIRVISDPTLDARGHAAVDLVVTTTEGDTHLRQLDIPPGFPGAELDDAQHRAIRRLPGLCAPSAFAAQAEQFLQSLEGIAALPDVRRSCRCWSFGRRCLQRASLASDDHRHAVVAADDRRGAKR